MPSFVFAALRPFILTLALTPFALSQDTTTLSVKVNLVSVLATVHGEDGKIVSDLDKDAFVLKEDGKQQTIRYFSKESDLPLTIGLLVDTSRSQRGVLERERQASNTFLSQVLREDKDQAFVVQFDDRVHTLQGLTSSRSDLAGALARLQIPPAFATLIFSAIVDSSDTLMSGQSGRKALILLTDGVAYKDPASIERAIDSAQRADTLIFAIDFSDKHSMRRPVRAVLQAAADKHGKSGLERMAKETGGAYYEVTEDQTIEAIYTKIEDTLRSQYSLGYTPDRHGRDGKFHKLKLTVKDSHLVVQTREGYYAK